MASPQSPLRPAWYGSRRRVGHEFRLVAVRQSHKVPHSPGKEGLGVSQTACDPRRPCVWRAGRCIRTSAGKCLEASMEQDPFRGFQHRQMTMMRTGVLHLNAWALCSIHNLDAVLERLRGQKNLEPPEIGKVGGVSLFLP